jgi:hypothetical protein
LLQIVTAAPMISAVAPPRRLSSSDTGVGHAAAPGPLLISSDPITVKHKIVGSIMGVPHVAYSGYDATGAELARGGLAWVNGRCFACFDHLTRDVESFHRRRLLLAVSRQVLQRARQLGEKEVFAIRDAEEASSARFLKHLGFTPTGETVTGMELWVWQASEP